MASSSRILIGTSSWTDPTLIKESDFYPPGVTSPEKRLRFYATRFPLVEVDSSYYYPPSEANSVRWVERTPDGFTFNIKAYSLLTDHPTRPDSLFADIRESMPPIRKRFVYREQLPQEAVDEVWQRFHDALLPLHEAGKLGAVLFQFPPWFVRNREHRGYIQECKARLADYRVAVEFRHHSWMSPEHTEDTLGYLEELDLPYVCVDMPQGFESSVPPIAAATTADLAMVRFHGRNVEAWEAPSDTASARFRYEYGIDELKEWAPKIEGLAEQARETHVLMNNCYRDFAVRNARELGGLLDLDLGDEEQGTLT